MKQSTTTKMQLALPDVGKPSTKCNDRTCERQSRPIMGFGVLNDNTIKELTYLHEIMSRNLIQELILNEMARVVWISYWHYLYVTSKLRKENLEQGVHG